MAVYNSLSTGYYCIMHKECSIYLSFLLSPEELLSMQEFAKSKGMEVIPLVQTFGHMEVKLNLHSSVNPANLHFFSGWLF